MEAEKPKRSTVFISYSHQDGEWLARLRVHLRPLEREDKVEIWDDTKITPGTKWNEEIKKALSHTKVAVLLVSADFLASDFIAADELPPLLLAAEEDGAKILPLILSPSRFRKTKSLAQFQAANDPERPLISLSRSDQETVLVKLSEEIEGYLKDASPERASEAYIPHPGPVPAKVGESSYQGTAPGQSDSSPGASERTPFAQTPHRRSDGRSVFRRIPTPVWVAVITGTFALIGAYVKWGPNGIVSEKPIKYSAKVISAETEQPLPGTKVSVETQGVPQDYYTDPNGIFYVEFPGSTAAARMRIEKADYETIDPYITPSRTGTETIRLLPLKKYTYRVVDNKRPVEGAAVSVQVNGVEQTFTTKSDGLFHLKLPGSIKEVQIQIAVKGKEAFDNTVQLSAAGTNDIPIKSLPIGIKKESRSNPTQSNELSEPDKARLKKIWKKSS